MLTDANLQFSTNQAITASAASTNSVDLGVSRDIGITERPMDVVAVFSTLPAGPGGSTLQLQVQTSPDNATWTTIEQTGTVTVSTANAYSWANLLLSTGVQRYLQLNWVVGGGPLTAGAVSAYLVMQAAGQVKNYPRGYVA